MKLEVAWKAFYGAVLLVGMGVLWHEWSAPWPAKALWIAGGAAALFGLSAICMRFTRRHSTRMIAKLGERRTLTMEEFWDEFYSRSGLPRGRAEQVLDLLSEAVEVPVGKLRPSDRFLVELAPQKGIWREMVDDSESSVILLALRLEKKYGVHMDLKGIKTVDDYVRAACGVQTGASQ